MQLIKKISCHGYRGFQTRQEINLGLPNGNFGSGLTILIGPNGGGKSTLIEAFRILSNVSKVSFTVDPHQSEEAAKKKEVGRRPLRKLVESNSLIKISGFLIA